MSTTQRGTEVRLNLGCGARPLPGYINVDRDGLDTLRSRYPGQVFPEDVRVYDYDIFHLPFADGSVAEVRADSLLEHLSFSEEPRFLYEVKRVLRSGGLFAFSVPDFEEVVRLWLAARDEWKEFYREDEESIANQHWFGQHSYRMDNRWGYLTAIIYGNQHGEGQFHKNCYTEAKIRAVLVRLGFVVEELTRFRWKGDRDPMIQVKGIKL